MKRSLVFACVLAAMGGLASAQQGVTSNEIVVGTIQDLSGPLASVSKQIRDGMVLRVDEVNAQGGINGRQMKLIVEDAAYDPKRATLAAEKLVNRDKIFAMIGHIGTAQNLAAMPIQFEKNVVNFMPMTGAREMYEPAHKLKFAFMPPYYDQMRDAVAKLVREKGFKRVCLVYQDDASGQEILDGVEAGMKEVGQTLVEKASFKRGATEFTSQMTKLAAANCDFVALGTVIRETIGTIATGRKLGFTPTYLANFTAYTDIIHKLGGPSVNGLYAPMTTQVPYLDDASQPIRFWATKYQTRFGQEPSVYSAYGYMAIDAFVNAATKAGRNLTPDGFVKAMETTAVPADIFGSPAMTFGPNKRLGNADTRLSQIQYGRWKVVSDYMRAVPAKK